MNNSYSIYLKIAQRLRSIRVEKGLTQSEMAALMGVSQSHYYKLEEGNVGITKDSLKKLMRQEDVFGLLTGKKNEVKALDKYVYRYENPEKTNRILQVIHICIEEGMRIAKLDNGKSMQKAYKLLKVLDLDENDIWSKIRQVEKFTQKQMAYILEIDIKKYRKIEKGQNEENAVILALLYERLHYSPMLFLDRRRFCIDEYDFIFSKFSKNLQNRILRYIELFVELMDSEEEKEK